jgi:hypothetical protein
VYWKSLSLTSWSFILFNADDIVSSLNPAFLAAYNETYKLNYRQIYNFSVLFFCSWYYRQLRNKPISELQCFKLWHLNVHTENL